VEYFSSRLPLLVWQPSDRPEYLAGLKSRLEREARVNVLPAIELDVLDRWPAGPFDAVYSANTAHIMSWAAVCAMFEGVGSRLPEGGVFCLYGPFNLAGSYTAPSNAAFDAQLRREDPQMGLRDVDDLEVLAGRHHLALRERVALPANNQLLIFTHRGGSGNHD
jgi:hypothetical protein